MDEIIKKTIGNAKVANITELDFDSKKIGRIPAGLDQFPNLTTLSMNDCRLTSVADLPSMPTLERLELSDNRILGGLAHLTQFNKLKVLKLGGNRIESMDEVKQLAKLTSLTVLDLFECPVSKSADFKETMFKLIPTLKALNGYDQDGAEYDDEDDEEDYEDEEDDEDEYDEEDDFVEADEEEQEEETAAAATATEAADASTSNTAGNQQQQDDEEEDEDEDDEDEDEDEDEEESGDENNLRFLVEGELDEEDSSEEEDFEDEGKEEDDDEEIESDADVEEVASEKRKRDDDDTGDKTAKEVKTT